MFLTENYRSHQAILDASKSIIESNKERLINRLDGLSKVLTAAHPARQTLHEPLLLEYQNLAQEHARCAEQSEKRLIQDGVNPDTIAVLYHKHAQAEN
ncbi:MAG: hypothetical protein IPI65_16660 [Bacteroidetes bacterium]|nr:hypothetical protein [Bacteroidota bacterium]